MINFVDAIRKRYQEEYEQVKLALHSEAINGVCPRKLWNITHQLKKSEFSLPRLRLERRRRMERALILEDLKKATPLISELHPKTKKPLIFTGAGGVQIEMTAAGKNEEGWFLVQVSAVSYVQLERVLKNKLERGFPSLYGHCQLGMGYSKLDRCLVALSGEDGALYVEMVDFSQDLFNHLEGVIKTVTGDNPPPPINQHVCQSCSFEVHCYEKDYMPPVNCHTCLSASYQEEAIQCKRWGREVPQDVWSDGCVEHVFKPGLLNFAKVIEVKALENQQSVVMYELPSGKQFINCGNKTERQGMMVTSSEIVVGGRCSLEDTLVRAIKEEFSGTTIINQ